MGGKRPVVRLCPVCHSRNIERASALSGWLTPDEYICLDCGYRGPVVLEVELVEDEGSGEVD
ncbi:hypothetical protein B6U99_02580 [Candidatus Geothermarchaeota archaeon ex4572_27]|nr:MAG: hypothetical protein B6U99_02580 [Candidatus Geothermarchaeota archaeon ex4572_27]